MLPERILLDTNVFIVGYRDKESTAGQLLNHLQQANFTLLMSNDLLDQIRRVAKRVGGKDWAGLVIDQVWHDFEIDYVNMTNEEMAFVLAETNIPKEDVGIYLTAVKGSADCMISANHQFVREAAEQQNLFTTFHPEQFLARYFNDIV